MLHRAWVLLLAVCLMACGTSPLSPPVPTPTALPTATLLPLPPTFPPTPTVTATAIATATPEATATPSPPTTQSYLDPTGSVRLRLPADWQVEADTRGPGVLVRASSPNGEGIALAEVAMPLNRDDFIAVYVGEATTLQRTELPDGTLRYGGLDPQRGLIEYRFVPRGPLLLAIILADGGLLTEEQTAAFWEGMRFFPSKAAVTFSPPPVLPTAAPEAVVATTGGTVAVPEGPLEVIGEVANRSQSDLESVRVTVELLSADGRVVASASGPAERDLLLAGEHSPFRVTFTPAPAVGSWIGTRATAQGSPASFLLDSAALWLHATEPQGSASATGAGYTVTTAVQNDGSAPASFVRVVAVLYDAEGRVIGLGSAYADSAPLDAGSSRAVTITLPTLAAPPSDVARIEVWVNGKR